MPKAPEKPPALLKRAKNLAGAAGRIGKAAITGDTVRVDDATRIKRLSICESNKCGAFNKKTRVCNWCGCFMNEKAKYATEICGEREHAEENNIRGTDWWTGIVINANVKEKTAEAPKPQQAKQFDRNSDERYITGAKFLEKEAQLRMIFPTDGELVKKFNEFHTAESAPGGCSSCRKNGFSRSFELAIGHDFNKQGKKELVEKVRALYPNSKYISAPSIISWEDLISRMP
jgi:hypothetical protein